MIVQTDVCETHPAHPIEADSVELKSSDTTHDGDALLVVPEPKTEAPTSPVAEAKKTFVVDIIGDNDSVHAMKNDHQQCPHITYKDSSKTTYTSEVHHMVTTKIIEIVSLLMFAVIYLKHISKQ